jgi:aminopeptidase N
MKKRKIYISILIFALLFASAHQASAQIAPDSLAEKFADIEKKSFINLSANSRISGTQNYTRTASSNNFDINFYRCEWEVDPNIRFIKGKVTPYFTITSSTDKIVFDLSDTLTVDSITYHGGQLVFQKIGNDGLQLLFPSVLNAGQKDAVSIYYKGVPRQNLVQAAHSGVPVIWTLSEPYGAKEWWPCKNGLTDKTDSMDIIITSPAAYRGTSNGVLIKEEITGPDNTVYFKHRYPIATYLVAIAVTNYVTAIDSVQIGNKSLPVIMNAYPEYADYFKTATFYAKQGLVKFSELFGEYPFSGEQYSETQCTMGGGMEHQTNSFIGSRWNQLVAHELGHHWFGDMVTCGSWQHIWLNEGFGDYLQFIYVENFDTAIKRLHLQAHLNLAVTDSAGSVFVTDTSNAGRIFYTNLTYMKAGYVLHMLRGILGDSMFFKGLRTYLNDPALKNKFAVTADLERNLEQVSGKNLQSFFKKWIYGEGYPNYSSTWYQNNNNWARVQINQSTTHSSVLFYEMPVQLRFKNNSRDTVITISHQYSGQVFWINPGFRADSMFIDPYLWILAKERKVKKEAAFITPDYIQIYPNPAPEILNISLKNPVSEKITIILYNAAGQLVRQTEVLSQGRDELISIPTAFLAHGIYIVKITGNKNTIAIKKIIR